MSPQGPEDKAREEIDRLLTAAGWSQSDGAVAGVPVSLQWFRGTNRVVFNIAGNLYRLVTVIHYRTGIVYIRFVGSPADYDRIDVATI